MNHFVWIMVLSLYTIPTWAQLNPPVFDPPAEPIKLKATRTDQVLGIDGKLDESVWKSTPLITEFVQQNPTQGAAPSLRTEVRVLYNQKYLYVGAICHDQLRHKSALRVQNLRRDFDFDENDLFGVAIDGLLDKRNAASFQTTPYGSQRDLQVIDGSTFNREWDALWFVRTHVTDSCWSAEFAIPWKTLRYPSGCQEIGVTFLRNIRRLNENITLPAVPRALTPYRMTYEALLTGLKPPPPSANFQLNPFVLYDANWASEGTTKTNEVKPKLGGELKWAIRPNTVVDLTLNTDFAQADADRQVVNLTRFSVLFPERRQFFLEGANVFNATADDFIQPFFSRRIGLDNNGNRIPLDGGMRLTHTDSKRTVGALIVRQRATSQSPLTHFGVFRYSHNFGLQNRVGGMLTYRHDGPFEQNNQAQQPNQNYTVTVDGLLRPSQRLNIGFMASGSKDTRLGDGLAAQGWVGYQDNVIYVGLLQFFVRNYQPGIGIERFGTDYVMTSPAIDLDLRPSWLPKFVRSYGPDAFLFAFHDPRSGKLISADARISPFDVTFQTGANVEIAFEPNWQLLAETDDFVGVPIGAGRYEFVRTRLSYNSDQSKKYSGRAEFATGPYYDGMLREYNASLRLAPLPHVELSADYGFNQFKQLGVLQRNFSTHLIGLNARLALNPRVQLVGFYQRNTAVNRNVWNVRLAWEYRPLSYLYLVFNSNQLRTSATERLRQDQAIAKFTFLKQI
jgi:hypothetical protein